MRFRGVTQDHRNYTIRQPAFSFLLEPYSNFVSIMRRFKDIRLWKVS